jgi:hypothetical protein
MVESAIYENMDENWGLFDVLLLHVCKGRLFHVDHVGHDTKCRAFFSLNSSVSIGMRRGCRGHSMHDRSQKHTEKASKNIQNPQRKSLAQRKPRRSATSAKQNRPNINNNP